MTNKVIRKGLREDPNALIMYIDMNSFFASCEQQDNPALREVPIGVCTHESAYACVIAPSIEAKRYGIKTGMRLSECRQLCSSLMPITARPWRYRQIHLGIMEILRSYCEEVVPKSIDEAVLNLSTYRKIYTNPIALAIQIKKDIKARYDYLRCSIGIAPNTFLAKLGTELQKPDGLVVLTPENIDTHLASLQLTDLPGIASRTARRLELAGVRSPLQMRHTSPALLRRAFGSIAGDYWYYRLNFKEVDLYSNPPKSMSAARTLSFAQRHSPDALETMLSSLCTRLEQRMVKQDLFCKEVSFAIRYTNRTSWDTKIPFAMPRQDALDLRKAILDSIRQFEQQHPDAVIFNSLTLHMSVTVHRFVPASQLNYTLFENTWKQDKVRKTIYNIKDRYGHKSIYKASEVLVVGVMKDAIGFGSVKEMDKNPYLLEPQQPYNP